jgi:hypothetical protein
MTSEPLGEEAVAVTDGPKVPHLAQRMLCVICLSYIQRDQYDGVTFTNEVLYCFGKKRLYHNHEERQTNTRCVPNHT